jgi:N-acylneuraminate cytidylyltransferase
MIDGLKVLAVIPARGGSKGLPRKNVLPLAGKPLVAWTLEAAHASRYIDRTILSSDDDEIIATTRKHSGDVPFKRPAHLSGDATTTIEVAFHAIEQLPGFDVLVILQPTSPLRTTEDIDTSLEKLISTGAVSCVSVTEPDKSPYWAYRIGENDRVIPVIDAELARCRRQDLPAAYVLNGAVFVAHIQWLMEHRSFVGADTVVHIMPRERSLDIDTLLDLQICETVMSAQQPISAEWPEPRQFAQTSNK